MEINSTLLFFFVSTPCNEAKENRTHCNNMCFYNNRVFSFCNQPPRVSRAAFVFPSVPSPGRPAPRSRASS